VRRSKQSGKKERRQADNSVYKIERAARDRADDQARRVPWQLLLETRSRYIEMQEFCFWARSVIETEDGIPGWLAKMLDRRCPGFIEDQQRCESDRSRAYPPLSVRLLFWSQEHMFGRARNEGWFDAVQFYAIRDPRSKRAEVYWSECVKTWRKAKPRKYPSLKQWLSDAAGCDPFTHLTPGARKARASYRLVEPKHLSGTVARYLDWEALAYWARPALEASTPLVHSVARELARRCRGFLEVNAKARKADHLELPQDWHRLMLWITDHFFQDAKTGGWMDAILSSARSHPRAIRTMEYWEQCDEIWASNLPDPYPSFRSWRKQADSYVVSTPNEPSQLAC
jgi:hypothetical protein